MDTALDEWSFSPKEESKLIQNLFLRDGNLNFYWLRRVAVDCNVLLVSEGQTCPSWEAGRQMHSHQPLDCL